MVITPRLQALMDAKKATTAPATTTSTAPKTTTPTTYNAQT